METYIIRLRAGWECAAGDERGVTPSRLILPVRASTLPNGNLRLIRRFQCPPRIPDSMAILRLSRCPGISSIRLNGRPIGAVSSERSEIDVDLGHLGPRNELVIEANPPREDAEWGNVSLIFGRGDV